MPIFKEAKGKLKKLKTLPVKKEKDLQSLVEENLLETLDMHFLASEYQTTFGGRIDTLAVDTSGAPVIIEYKRNKNDNVINQGLSYLKWLKAQKVEFFEMLVMKMLDEKVRKSLTVDWKNPRVICIAESYSKFDIDTVEVIPIRIELLKYRYYEDGIFSLEPQTLIKQLHKSTSIIQEEKLGYETPPNPEQLIEKCSDKTKKIFNLLQEKILSLDENIVQKVVPPYVAFRLTKSFCEVYPQKEKLKLLLRVVDYDDPKSIVENLTHYWSLNCRVYLKDLEDLDYVFRIIEQSYKDVL